MNTHPVVLEPEPAQRPVAPIPLAMMTAGERSQLRDDIAMAALPAMLAAATTVPTEVLYQVVASEAYQLADAMLKARGAA